MSVNPKIVQLTSWSTSLRLPSRGGSDDTERTKTYVIYGVDEHGEEHVYAEFDNNEDFDEWRRTDPLAHDAWSRMFRALLDNPQTRDTVIKINLQSALDSGDTGTAFRLFTALSPDERRRLLGEAKEVEDD